MNRLARGAVLIGFGLLLQNSFVFAAYDAAAEARLNKATKKQLLENLESISLFYTTGDPSYSPVNVFVYGMEDKAEEVLGPARLKDKTYNFSDEVVEEASDKPVWNKLVWDQLLRYGVLNFARKNAATSKDLPIYWNHCMRANQQLRNFADILAYSFQEDTKGQKYNNGQKVKLFQSLMEHFKSVVEHLEESHEKLKNIWFVYPGRRATKELILKVNEKLLKAFDKIMIDYIELKKSDPSGVLSGQRRKKPLPSLPPGGLEKQVEDAIVGWQEETGKKTQDERAKVIIEGLMRNLGQKTPEPKANP